MRPVQVVKIDHIELRADGITSSIFEQLVIGDPGKVIELEVIDEHRKALSDMLVDDMAN